VQAEIPGLMQHAMERSAATEQYPTSVVEQPVSTLKQTDWETMQSHWVIETIWEIEEKIICDLEREVVKYASARRGFWNNQTARTRQRAVQWLTCEVLQRTPMAMMANEDYDHLHIVKTGYIDLKIVHGMN
jgi:hypothetical protein